MGERRPPAPRAGRRLALREPANSLTHLLGAVLAVWGAIALLRAAPHGQPLELAAFAIYGASLVVLYVASTLLHALPVGQGALRRLRIFDHSAIFGLIAGSYTPVLIVALRAQHPVLAWVMLVAAWGVAALGVLFKVAWIGAPRWLSTGLYLAMGWLAVMILGPLARALPPAGLAWLALGGLFYTVGAVIYARRRPDPLPEVFGYHALWHLFVLAGSACHYLLMFRHVLPLA